MMVMVGYICSWFLELVLGSQSECEQIPYIQEMISVLGFSGWLPSGRSKFMIYHHVFVLGFSD